MLLWKKQLMVGKHENERELLVEHSLGRNLIDDPQKTFPGISVLFSFKMFVSERKRSAEDKIRRCLVSPLPRSLFIADHQIYHSFSFWWQSKQIYHLCHQNPIRLNTTLSYSLWRVLLSQLNVFNLQSGEVLATS